MNYSVAKTMSSRIKSSHHFKQLVSSADPHFIRGRHLTHV